MDVAGQCGQNRVGTASCATGISYAINDQSHPLTLDHMRMTLLRSMDIQGWDSWEVGR